MLIDCALYHDGKRIKKITLEEVDGKFKDAEFIWAAYVFALFSIMAVAFLLYRKFKNQDGCEYV